MGEANKDRMGIEKSSKVGRSYRANMTPRQALVRMVDAGEHSVHLDVRSKEQYLSRDGHNTSPSSGNLFNQDYYLA